MAVGSGGEQCQAVLAIRPCLGDVGGHGNRSREVAVVADRACDSVMTLSVHVTSQTALDELSHDAQVLRSVLGELRSAEGRSVVEELISGMLADGVVLARVDGVVTPREAGELLGVSRQFVDKLIASGRLAAKCKPGSRHRVVRVADVLQLEASRRAGADRIGSTIDTLVDAGAEY